VTERTSTTLSREPALRRSRPAPTLGYQPALDGVRAVAVIAVLLFHSGFGFARGGYLGVSAFFTLSGFLITTLLLQEHRVAGSISLRAFWARRLRRLMPASLLAIALSAVYVWVAAPHAVATAFRGDGLAALFDVANWRFVLAERGYLDTFATATGATAEQSPVLHFWSLAIEEQFYLVFPVLLAGLLVITRRRRALLAAALSLGAAASLLLGVVFVSGDNTTRAYFGTDTRAAELLIGALLALVAARRRATEATRAAPGTRIGALAHLAALAGWLALGALILAWTRVDHHDPVLFRGGLVLHALLTAIVISVSLRPGPLRRVLSIAPLVALGRISYGVYVYHWPIFQWIDGDGGRNGGWRLFTVRMAVTLPLAIVSYAFVEQPIRHGRAVRARIWRSAIPAFGCVAALVIVATVSPPVATTVFEPVAARTGSAPLDGAAARVAELDEDLPAMPDTRANGLAGEVRVGGARATDRGATITSASQPPGTAAPVSPVERVLVVGDSVALTLGRGIERWGFARGVPVWNLGRAMCPIGRSDMQVGYEVVHTDGCANWPELYSSAVEAFDPTTVVVLSPIWDGMLHYHPTWEGLRGPGDPEYDAWLHSEYAAAAAVLSARGARIYWLEAPCGEGRDLSAAAAGLNRVLERVARDRVDSERIELSRLLCDPDGAFAESRADDGYHFTDPGADLVAGWLMPQLRGK